MLHKTALLAALSSALLLGACAKGEQQSTASASAAPAATDKTYIVATDASYAPFEYMEGNQVVGFSHDILKAAGEKEGIKLNFVNTPFEGIFANVEKGDSDIALASITGTKVANAAGVMTGAFTVPAGLPTGTKTVEFTGANGSSGTASYTGSASLTLNVKYSSYSYWGDIGAGNMKVTYVL